MYLEEVVEHQFDPNHPLTKNFISPQIQEYQNDQNSLPKLDDPSYNWIFKTESIYPNGAPNFGKRISFSLNCMDSYFELNHRCVGFKDVKIKFRFKLNGSNFNFQDINLFSLINRVEFEVGGTKYDSIESLIIPYLNYKMYGHNGYNFEVHGDHLWIIFCVPLFMYDNNYFPLQKYHESRLSIEINSRQTVFGENVDKYNGLEINDLELEFHTVYTDKLINDNLLNGDILYYQPVVQNQYFFERSDYFAQNCETWKMLLHFNHWLHSIVFCIKSNNKLIKESIFKKIKLQANGQDLCVYYYDDLKECSGLSGYYTIPFNKNEIDEYKDIHKSISGSKVEHLLLIIYWDQQLIQKYEPFEIYINGITYNVLDYNQGMSWPQWLT